MDKEAAGSGGCPRRHGLRLPFLPQLWGPALTSGLSGALHRGRGPEDSSKVPPPCHVQGVPGAAFYTQAPCWALGMALGAGLPRPCSPAGRSGLGVQASGPELGSPEPPGEGGCREWGEKGLLLPRLGGAGPHQWDSSEDPRLSQVTGRSPGAGPRTTSTSAPGGQVCVGVGLRPCVLGREKLSRVCRTVGEGAAESRR